LLLRVDSKDICCAGVERGEAPCVLVDSFPDQPALTRPAREAKVTEAVQRSLDDVLGKEPLPTGRRSAFAAGSRAPRGSPRLQFVEARGAADFDRAFSDMIKARAGALTVFVSNFFFVEHRRLVDLAAKNRLPAVYQLREFVDAGGLMSYGPNLADVFRRPTWTRF
jgi:hypothetical protein